ncbi:hypothetical protein [Paenibacillus lautus]|uniref:hypothetical protein n=1 Tax=Paenibacillus lautus TaxID=1401 RepID=UPI003D2735E8
MYILPVKYPPITSFTKHANILSIISTNDNYLDWFLSNYIQLWYRHDMKIMDFYMPALKDNCPLLYTQRINRDFVNTSINKDTVEFFIDSIKTGYYISVVLDEYYIPPSRSYNKRHHPHETLIYGFDTEKETFNVADFYMNRKYQYETISFNELRNSYSAVTDSMDYLGAIYFHKIGNSNNYTFNINLVHVMTRHYLKGENSSKFFSKYETAKTNGWEFGYNIYPYIFEHIKLLENNEKANVRMLHVLQDHKKCMEMRIKFLLEKSYIKNHAYDFINLSSNLTRKALILRNLGIKNNIKCSKKIIQEMKETLKDIQLMEKELLINLSTEIDKVIQ